jgi:hypothetical protein
MSRALMLFGTLAIGVAAGWLLKSPKRNNSQPRQSKRKK